MLLTVYSAIAQNPFIRHFTTQDGLPTNTLYQMIQDHNKFIWITSDAGLIKYDGSVFTNIRKKDGLSSNEIVRIKEDYKGRIWLSNYNSAIDFIADGVIHNNKNTPFLQKMIGKGFLLDFFVDFDSILCFYNYQGELFKLMLNNDVKFIKLFDGNTEEQKKIADNLKITGMLPLNRVQYLIVSNKGIFKLDSGNPNHFNKADTLNVMANLRIANGENLILTRSQQLYQYKFGEYLRKIQFNRNSIIIHDALIDADGTAWILVEGEGVYMCRDDEIRLILKVNDAHGLMQDHEKNIWVSTRNNGLYKIEYELLNQKHFEQSNFQNGELKEIRCDENGFLWLATDSKLFELRNGQLYQFDLPGSDWKIQSFFPWKNTLLVNMMISGLSEFSGLKINNAFKKVTYSRLKSELILPRSILVDNNKGEMIAFYNNAIARTAIDNPFNSFSTQSITEHINYAYINAEGNIVINARNNYLYKDGNLIPYKDIAAFNGSIILDNQAISKTCDVLNVDGDSLYLVEKGKIVNLTRAFSFPIQRQINKMAFDKGVLYIATLKEIFFCQNPGQLLSGKNRIELDAIPINFNNINDITIIHDTLFVASNDGLTAIRLGSGGKLISLKPIPYIVSVIYNDVKIPLNENKLTLKGDRKIVITVGAISYTSGEIIYEYKIEGFDEKWNSGVGNRLDLIYQNLSPGNYIFKVRVRKTNSDWSDPLELKIIVKPTLLQHPLFKILIFVIILGLISYIFNRIRISRLRKVENDLQLVVMEQKALQAMMNPHFIFNSLGSVQNFMLKNQGNEAVVYLSDFAKLIRQNLNSINASFVLLDEEVDRLNNYLNLEMVRLENKFDFKIELDHDLEDDTVYIPGMIIQPFVENAIWHGIATLNFKGHILVSFKSYSKNQIQIIIEDNGIGIQGGLEFSGKSSKQSRLGINITYKRLQLLGKKYKTETKLKFSNAIEQAQFPGTKVELIVPYTFKITD